MHVTYIVLAPSYVCNLHLGTNYDYYAKPYTWKVYVSRKLVYIWNMSTHRSTTYVYVRTREKM